MIKFLKRLLFGKHYEAKKRLREGNPIPRPQEEKDLQLRSLLSKLDITPEESERILLNTLGNKNARD